jgi:hypothetical protein
VESFNGLFLCKECRDYKKEEVFKVKLCAICGWPINNVITKNKVKDFLNFLSKWLKEKNKSELLEIVKTKIEVKDFTVCRYDFFEFVEKILENLDLEVAEEFKNIFTKKYDFKDSIIS